MNDRNLTPWYGVANLETDEPPMTHCGKTVEPIRMRGGSAEKQEAQRPEELAQELKRSAAKVRTISQMLKVANARRDWSNYEI